MIVAIHQPNYLPYLGFFDKIKQSDIFVIYDDAQFNKEDFQHRNKIRIYHGWKYLTIPVVKKNIQIKDIKIRNEFIIKSLTWQEAHLKDIRDNYIDAPYYDLYCKQLETIYTNKYNKLIDLNMDIINFLMVAFEIKKKIILSSELGFTSKSTQRLADITESLGGDVYLSGPAGRNYLDVSIFESKGINVDFQDFRHPIYKQCYDGFISNMSAIDALFNLSEMPRIKE
ncbi:MAG: WbqC family protein [Candidatus Methanoperedens sp.]|nr:WbqC family protein [Candidatus Methanoperedens sp.]